MSDPITPWERRLDLGESGPAYHAFVHFRDLPVRTRSLDRAYTVCRVTCDRQQLSRKPAKAPETLPCPLREATGNWKTWRRQFQWDARAAAFDRHVDAEYAEGLRAANRAMNERHAAIAEALSAKITERLELLTAQELEPRDLAKALEACTTVERRARGEATELVKHLTTQPVSDALDLSKLTDEELELLERLHKKAAPASADGAGV
jgi:hypothetical protein